MADKEWTKREGNTGVWLPEEVDEELVGVITEIDEEGSYGTQWVITDADEVDHRTPSHKVLQNRMSGLELGDEVKIVYRGEEPPSVKGNNPTRLYDVYTKGGD